jgi:two-component system nitrate/nitrite response regulator NarL
VTVKAARLERAPVTHYVGSVADECPHVLLVEGETLLAQCLARTLVTEGFFVTHAVSQPGIDLLQIARESAPDLIVLDLDTVDASTSRDRLVGPLSGIGPVVLLNGTGARTQVAESLAAGALAVVGKNRTLDELVHTLRQAARGAPLPGAAERDALLAELWRQRSAERQRLGPFAALTRAEQDVLAALMEGLTTNEIAGERFVSLETVRSQVKSVLRKLGVNSQLAAVALARSSGWIPARSR